MSNPRLRRSAHMMIVGCLLSIAGCIGDPTIKVQGRVVDEAGDAIGGAALTVKILPASMTPAPPMPFPPLRGESDQAGAFDFMSVEDPKDRFVLRVEKAGFEPYEAPVAFDSPNLTIRLRRKEASP